LAQKITGEQFWVEVSMRKTEIGGQGRILAVVRDVSERKRAEEALRIAHERLADMIEYFPDPTFVIDKESRVIAWNHAMEVLSGVAKTEMLGKGDYAYAVPFFGKRQPILIDMLDAPPSELDSVYKFVKMVGDRLYAESYMQAVYQGKGAHLWGVAAPLYDHTGTRWGTIEVIRDVTDRIESAERLQESERKVRAIFDLSFGFIGVLTLDGTLVEANKTALDFAGVQLSDVLGKPFWETPWWSHSQEMQNRVRIAIMSAANGDLIQSEATHLAQDGTPHTIDFTLKPVMNEAGRVTMLIAEGRDITERKRAEEALRENEERMRAIVEGTPDLFFYTQDADAMTTYVSPTVEHITGYTPGIWLQRKDWFVTDAAINLIARKRTHAHLRGQFTGEPILMEVRHALGHPILLEAYEYPISKNERVVGLQGVAHDITRSKQAEESLRDSEDRFGSFVEQSVDGLLLIDEKGILREWNLAMEQMTGIPRSEVEGRPWVEYMEMSVLPERRSPERLEQLRKSAETMLHRGGLSEGKRVFEIEMMRRDGKRIIVQQTLFSMPTPAGFRIGSINRDITLIKQAEASLRKNEMLHRLITENVPDVIWTLDFKTGKFSYVSDSVQKLRGFTPAEVMSQSIAETMTPESLAIVTEMMQKGIDERKPGERGMLVKELEVEQLCKDGSLVPTEVRVTTLFDEQGQPIEFIGISRDITERKRAEVALRESEERFRTLSSIASEGLMIHEQGVIVDANPAFATLIGYSSPDELIGKNGFETVQFTPESRQLVLDQMRTNSDDAYDIEIIQVSGKIVPAETKGTEIVYKGRTARLVSMRDITERKRAESALRESESRFRQIAENIHEVFFLCEKEGNKLLYVNPACTSIFGVTPEMLKADGTLSHRVIHPDDLSNVTYVDAERFYSAPIDEEYRILRPVDGAV
ncbi:MAG: PAS domain S-box protein, partial [Ignavibacteriales bacterium]|nr:PAS domain S-box protein [Ignavibacteriales bacterium]